MIVVFLAAVVITYALGGWWPDRTVEPALALAALGVDPVRAVAGRLGVPGLDRQRDRGLHGVRRRAGGGLLGQIGEGLSSETLQDVSIAASWLLPFEALYQAALGALTADTVGFTRLAIDLGPFGGAQDFGPLLWPWAVVYLAAVGAAATWAFSAPRLVNV